MASAKETVFNTTELLEHILLSLDSREYDEWRTLLNCQQVSQLFNSTIAGSKLLQDTLFVKGGDHLAQFFSMIRCPMQPTNGRRCDLNWSSGHGCNLQWSSQSHEATGGGLVHTLALVVSHQATKTAKTNWHTSSWTTVKTPVSEQSTDWRTGSWTKIKIPMPMKSTTMILNNSLEWHRDRSQ